MLLHDAGDHTGQLAQHRMCYQSGLHVLSPLQGLLGGDQTVSVGGEVHRGSTEVSGGVDTEAG